MKLKIGLVLVLLLGVLTATFSGCVNQEKETLDVEIKASFDKGWLSPIRNDDSIKPTDDKTTLKVEIKSKATYEDIGISVSIPRADNLHVSPIDQKVDRVGAGESRKLDFVITSSGQGKGTYDVLIKVYDEHGENLTKEHVTQIYVE